MGTSRGGRPHRALVSAAHVNNNDGASKDVVPASVRPQTGPASTRVKSRTRIPSSAYRMSPESASTRLGASPILVMNTGLMFVWYIPCGVMSIASNERSAAAHKCR